MFGSLGVTELILILVIVLIVFGAGKLPKIGEGMGKALKSFKKEMHEAEPAPVSSEQSQAVDAHVVTAARPATAPQPSAARVTPPTPASASPQLGPAATPGTTAHMVAQQAWKPVAPQPVVAPSPSAGSPTALPGGPAQAPQFQATVNKEAVKRVMAQQALIKPKVDVQAAEAAGVSNPPAAPQTSTTPSSGNKGPTPQDFQSVGAGLGDVLRTFRDAANDVRRTVDPPMHAIKAEIEAAHKDLQATIDEVKQGPRPVEPPSKSS